MKDPICLRLCHNCEKYSLTVVCFLKPRGSILHSHHIYILCILWNISKKKNQIVRLDNLLFLLISSFFHIWVFIKADIHIYLHQEKKGPGKIMHSIFLHTFSMSDTKSPLRERRLMSLLPTSSSLSAAVIASTHTLIPIRAHEMLNTC